MKKLLLLLAVMAVGTASAKDYKVTTLRYAGPYEIRKPVMVDSVGLDSKPFKDESLLNTPLKLELARSGQTIIDGIVPRSGDGMELHLLGFEVRNTSYAKAKIALKGLKNYRLFIDGKQQNGAETSLIPGMHEVVVKYLTTQAVQDTVHVTLSTDADVTIGNDGSMKRLLTVNDIFDGVRIGYLSLSCDGRYIITSYTETLSTGRSATRYRVSDAKMGRIVGETDHSITWMPSSCRYYYTQQGEGGRRIVTADPATGEIRTLAEAIPNDAFTIAPNEKFLILTHRNDGPTEDKDVHQIIEPDDRQPGWRNRYSLIYYDIATGMSQPLTFGHQNVSLQDISQDGRYLLYTTSHSRLEKRPTTVSSIHRLDLQTMQTETLVENDGFLHSARFSPDGTMLAVKASPEAFGGIGVNVPEGRTPSMYDYQMFLFDIASRKATALTRTFNPSIENYLWSKEDGRLYFTALDRDCIHLFVADAKTKKIQMVNLPEETVRRISLAKTAPLMVWTGMGASNSTRSYLTNLRTGKTTLIEDQMERLYKDIQIGECQAWDFVSLRGDTICGRYYLPPLFDSSKKYPMIVYYYGGCSPTSRYFENSYAPHLYAAQGYVVFVVNPSGAAGFGQEYSSRHVNTAGDYVADDIIEGTKQFIRSHSFVDGKHVGCMGASYGGFMTQYLQTKTDIFAAAMSHAGISDHTSYWGEGYWGYSYSETSMANSYPWSHKDLYVDHSPLYNADKIHTPILFLHGTADTNVPIGESIQMFNALKLLGRETAFVVVEGENHWILDYKKREKWMSTIFAWFQKWLKGDSSWWDSMYKEKAL